MFVKFEANLAQGNFKYKRCNIYDKPWKYVDLFADVIIFSRVH